MTCRACLRIDSAPAHNLTHDRIEGRPVGVVDILVVREPPIDRLPEQTVEPVNAILASAASVKVSSILE